MCERPRDQKNSGVILALYGWLNNSGCFSVPFMTLAVDVIDRRGSSDEMRHQLQPMKTKVRLYISCLYSSKRRFIRPSLLIRWSALVLKVGVSSRWKWQDALQVIAKED